MAEKEGPEEEPEEKQEKADFKEPGNAVSKMRKIVLIIAVASLVFSCLMIFSEDLSSFVYSLFGRQLHQNDVMDIVMSDGFARDFIGNHSNASIKFSLFGRQEATLMFSQMMHDCNITQDLPDEIYRVIMDTESGKSLTGWVDWGNRSVICVVKSGEWSLNCTSRANDSCYGGELYWFDSCGNREGIKQNCYGRCRDSKCLVSCTGENGNLTATENISCCSGLEMIPNTIGGLQGCILQDNISYICTKCGNGLCQLPENECNCPEDCNLSCDDSDGIDYLTWGKVTRESETKKDTCLNKSILVEYYCENKAIMSETYKCPDEYECHSGKCIDVELPCLEDGEVGMDYPGYKCCEGLVQTDPGDPKNFCESVPHIFICINCTNSICGLGENGCNCPQDCGEPY